MPDRNPQKMEGIDHAAVARGVLQWVVGDEGPAALDQDPRGPQALQLAQVHASLAIAEQLERLTDEQAEEPLEAALAERDRQASTPLQRDPEVIRNPCDCTDAVVLDNGFCDGCGQQVIRVIEQDPEAGTQPEAECECGHPRGEHANRQEAARELEDLALKWGLNVRISPQQDPEVGEDDKVEIECTGSDKETKILTEGEWEGQRVGVMSDGHCIGHRLEPVDHYGLPTAFLMCSECQGIAFKPAALRLTQPESSEEEKAIDVLLRFMCCEAGREFVDERLLRPFGYTLDEPPVVWGLMEATDFDAQLEDAASLIRSGGPKPDYDAVADDLDRIAKRLRDIRGSRQPESPGNSGEAIRFRPWGSKRWRIWNFDATHSGVEGPETLPPDGAPQQGLKATEDAPVEVMAVAEHEAILRAAAAEVERLRSAASTQPPSPQAPKALTAEERQRAEDEGAAAGECPFCGGGMDAIAGVHTKDCPLSQSPAPAPQPDPEDRRVEQLAKRLAGSPWEGIHPTMQERLREEAALYLAPSPQAEVQDCEVER